MRIESVTDKPDRAGRYYVKFENGNSMRLYRQTVEDFGLYPGLDLTQEQLQTLRTAAGKMSAKMRAVRIVSASSVSKQDLEQRLVRKGESPEQAREAVAWMEDLNLIDDAQTARQIVNRCICKGYGPARARQALYEKRIPRQYWDAVLEDYPDQQEKIRAFLETRLQNDYDPRNVKRAVDALIRRGHTYGNIQQVLRELSLEQDEFPEE